MRKFLTLVFLSAFFAVLPASAQNTRVDGIALTRGGAPAPGANVAVCTQPATTTSTPCSPLANLCATLSDTLCGQPNPVKADGLGNYHFYLATGTVYTLQLYGTGLTTRVQTDQGGGGGGGGGSGITCSGAPSVVIQSAIGQLAICDPQMVPDGNGSLALVNLTASGNVTAQGTISGNRVATNGTGGIVDLQFQTPPTVAGLPMLANHAYTFANTNTGLSDCLKNVGGVAVECFGGIQALGQGAVSLPTSAITSGACSSVVTLTATGATTSSHIIATPSADPTGVTGYAPSASGSVYVQAYVTANTANFKVCNNTSGTITPGALTLNAVVF